MQLNDQINMYANGTLLMLAGSFRMNGTTPDTIRDGHAFMITGVTRVSVGLYEVQFDTSPGCNFPIPELPFIQMATVSDQGGTATKMMQCHVVDGSWSNATRKFRIVCYKTGDSTSGTYVQPALADPDTLSRINFFIVGSINSSGTDVA